MSKWEIYDRLLEPIAQDAQVVKAAQGPHWTRVTSSLDATGAAYTIPVDSMPKEFAGEFVGSALGDVARLAKSWNFSEASFGQAALNSWYSASSVAEANGFVATGSGVGWGQVFDPFADLVRDKQVAIIGHFPFARKALADAGELIILERNLRDGDYPDSAAEYILPVCDFVFISSSSFVNKTAPRLIELAESAFTVLVGPSTPLAPLLFDYGVDLITGMVADDALGFNDALDGLQFSNMLTTGHRVHRFAPDCNLEVSGLSR